MLKTIEIEYMNGSMVHNLEESIQDYEYLDKIEIDEKNNLIKISYNETLDNFKGIATISAVSIFLCVDYIVCFSKYAHKEKEKTILLSTIASDIYFANSLLIQLINYFNNNTRLKENIFFRFNMSAFGRELDFILNDFEQDNILKKAASDMHNILKQNKFSFKKFQTLRVSFDEDNCFELIAKDGTVLTPETAYDVLGIEMEFDETGDDFFTMIFFCNLMISILEVKTLIIPSDCEDFYEVMSEQTSILEYGVSLVVADNV